MFERAPHRRIVEALGAFDASFMKQSECWFGGGTAIVLELGEFRESVDIDFLCASKEG